MPRLDRHIATLIASLLSTIPGCAPTDDDAPSGDPAALAQQAEAIDLNGTWGIAMTTSSEMTAPLIGKSASTAKLAMRLYVHEEAGQYRADVQICRLSTDSATVKIDYANVLPFMKTTVSVPPFEPALGGEVPLPDLVFRIGQDGAGAAVDVDNDGRPAITVPIVALGLLSMKAYTGFELKVGLEAKLVDAQTIQGSYAFSAVGKGVRLESPLLPPAMRARSRRRRARRDLHRQALRRRVSCAES